MKKMNGNGDDISVYIEDKEYIANRYVMRCFTVIMLVYTAAFLLNLLGVFIIEQRIMLQGYIPSVVIYLITLAITHKVPLSNDKMKFYILFSIILVFTIGGVAITYHVVVALVLPIMYATLYSSKKVMPYVYILTVISTFCIVYGGYYYGLCDANMVLLTTTSMSEYVVDGQFILTEVNSNPFFSLLLFFVLPRCLIYIALVFVCSNILKIVSGSLEKAKLTAELEKAKAEAENANRAKTEFLAKMSHEIRTPINAILGMNEMIIREALDENIQKYAFDVKNSSVVLLNIINEILDSSKIESGMMEIVPVNYEMGSLLNDLYNMISVKTAEKGLELSFQIDSQIPNEYYGDDKRIRQILLNLLTNAVKYTNQGRVTLSISCTIEGENANLHFTVKDTGIGIRSEDIGKIYDDFQRFDMERNRHVEGSGLGMKIVQQLLKLMGSKLEIQSEYEKGSEFSFVLVQKIVNREPLGDFRKRLQQATTQTGYQTKYIAPGASVLVVDDHAMNRKVFCELLKSTQIQISQAENGIKCLEMLEKERFDVIFLDHMMPEMDGVEAFHEIRRRNLCQGTPIIMLTANAIAGERDKYLKEGFDDFLSKPIIPQKLDDMVLKYLPKDLIKYEKEIIDVVVEQKPQELYKNKVLEKLRYSLPEVDLNRGLEFCSGDEEFYLEILSDFVKLPIVEELEKYSEMKDYKNYCIRIHGFKNNAYCVGATEMGDMAYEMEKKSREEFAEDLPELQRELFEKYRRVCSIYQGTQK